VLNDVLTDLSESLEGSERNSNEDVLLSGTVSALVLDLLGRGEEHLSDSQNVLWLTLLVLGKSLGALLFEVGVLLTLISTKQR
jgi:hypothetical protein